MDKALVELRASPVQADEHTGFVVTIEAPTRDTPSGDYCCRVASSGAIDFRLDVFGITKEQALRLALEVMAARVAKVLSSDLAEHSGQDGVE